MQTLRMSWSLHARPSSPLSSGSTLLLMVFSSSTSSSAASSLDRCRTECKPTTRHKANQQPHCTTLSSVQYSTFNIKHHTHKKSAPKFQKWVNEREQVCAPSEPTTIAKPQPRVPDLQVRRLSKLRRTMPGSTKVEIVYCSALPRCLSGLQRRAWRLMQSLVFRSRYSTKSRPHPTDDDKFISSFIRPWSSPLSGMDHQHHHHHHHHHHLHLHLHHHQRLDLS